MAEKKEKKPLLEALLGSVDGYEILAELAGEKKEKEEEVGEARRPPDTFTGILQGLIPLMILPQLLPLFQQSLAQTLQTATVNVKVESATAIIPVDISATTAIVPIEITASKVTLNVNITGQTALLNVSISGDASVVITGQNVGVALAGTWQTFLGYNKVFWSEGQLPGETVFTPQFEQVLVDYTVPSGRTLYVESINFNLGSTTAVYFYNVYGSGASYAFGYSAAGATFFVYIGSSVVARISLNSSQPFALYQPVSPLKVPAGVKFRIIGFGEPYGAWASVTVIGYEKTD